MFQVTEEAIAHAAHQLRQSNQAEGAVLRLAAHERGVTLSVGRVEPDDVVYEHDGRPVIAVSEALVEELGNVVLQAEEIADGARLQLRERG